MQHVEVLFSIAGHKIQKVIQRAALFHIQFDKLGPLFKGKAKQVADAISMVAPNSIKGKDNVMVVVAGENVVVPSSCFELGTRKEKVSGRKLVPHVIEPSYGVDRILFAVLEHAYSSKDNYVTLHLKGSIAPVKAGVFPLMARDGLDGLATEIHRGLSSQGLMAYYDDSGSIGRRYARMDEIGTPCCVTVDYDTKSDGTVTLRDRDTSEQVRIRMEKVPEAVRLMVNGGGLKSTTSLD